MTSHVFGDGHLNTVLRFDRYSRLHDLIGVWLYIWWHTFACSGTEWHPTLIVGMYHSAAVSGLSVIAADTVEWIGDKCVLSISGFR